MILIIRTTIIMTLACCRCVLSRKCNPWVDKPHMRNRFKFYEALLAGERPDFPRKLKRLYALRAGAGANASARASAAANGVASNSRSSSRDQTSVKGKGGNKPGWQETGGDGAPLGRSEGDDAAPYLWSASLRQLLNECWAHSSSDRPPFDEVVSRLKGC